jgi:uncharacterized membrane protein
VAEKLARLLARWTEAGVIDAPTADRIRAYEEQHAGSTRLRWPIWLALSFGGLMLGAGVLLFVSAHWDSLSPDARFALVLSLVAAFHLGAAAAADRFPGMATTLHGVGTLALGAGIFLAGQIFNLDEHWPGGLMLWALGAALAYAVQGAWPQLALTAVLTPAWLLGEWAVATSPDLFFSAIRVAGCGVFLLALAYFTAASGSERGEAEERGGEIDNRRRVLMWLGGVSLVPAAAYLAFGLDEVVHPAARMLPTGLRALGWTVALGLPLAVAGALRRSAAWPVALAALWVLALIKLRPVAGDLSVYAWWALGAMALAAWGVHESRSERINMGAAIFAATVVAFYFSHVMDKLGRSASLTGFGVLFLAGGWGLEQVRRNLVLRALGQEG